MNHEPLYLCLIEKEKRGRIKICFEGPFAKAILATCHAPKIAGMSFTWEMNNKSWNLENEAERKEFEQFLKKCQKEESRNFKIAIGEATHYIKRLTRQKKTVSNNVQNISPRTPLVTKEEIITKILSLRKDPFLNDNKPHIGSPGVGLPPMNKSLV